MIKLKNVSFLKSSIEAISSFIPEGNFRFNDNGIHFRATDPSQVVLVDYFIDKSSFDHFNAEPAFVGLNLFELNKIVSRALPNDTASISLSDSEMVIGFSGDFERSFKLPLIDVSDEEPKLPNTNYDASVQINAKVFKELLKDASLFSSSIVLKATGDKFFVESSGSSGTLNASSQAKAVNVKSKKDVVSKYSLNYLQNIVREADPDSTVLVELKSDSPMRVSFLIGKSEIKFYLAHMLL